MRNSLTEFVTFEFSIAPDASQEDQAYVEKWKYIIQLRCALLMCFIAPFIVGIFWHC